MSVLKNLPDEIHNMKIIKDLGMSSHLKTPKRMAIFKCICGNNFESKVSSITSGQRTSCGCLRNQDKKTHGLSNHPLYRKWSGMITRTTNKKEHTWDRYGGRGISVYKEWRENFKSFYDWSIKNGWEKGLTLDRIDVDGNYEPNNCQWITMKENSMKDRHSEFIKKYKSEEICDRYNNSLITVTELAKQYKTYKDVVSKILKKNNIEIKNRRIKK